MSRTHLHRSLRFIVLAMLVSAISLFNASFARAAVGDYTVNITHTQGDAWWSMGRDGAFRALDMKIETGIGSYPVNANRVWRIVTPGLGARIVGGRIAGQLVTPDAEFRGRVVVGDDGGAMRTLYESSGSASYSVAIPPGGHDWAQFDLLATKAVKTTATGRNVMTATAVILQLNDYTNPVLSIGRLPSATTWYGPACVSWQAPVTDQGSGVARIVVERVMAGLAPQTVATVVAPRTADSPMPGPSSFTASGCLSDAAREHGENEYIVTAFDVSGRTQQARFRMRVDLHGPVISGGVADASEIEARRPDMQLHISDADSGVASASAMLDGQPIELDQVAGRHVVVLEQPLAIGQHTLVVTATDSAGNITTERRQFTVVDRTPPVLRIDAMTERDDATLTVRASADDGEGSGIDASSWQLAVNGTPVEVHGDEASLSAKVGPLAPGTHELVLSVADVAGNVARTKGSHRITNAELPATLQVGGRSGVFVVQVPTTTVFGTAARITTLVVRNGHPVPSMQVTARRSGQIVGSATSTATGIATLSVPARATMPLVLSVNDAELAPARVTMGVAPRVTITTSTAHPRRNVAFTVSGRIAPGLTGRIVLLEARIGGRWVTIRRNVAVRAGGRFSASVVSSTRGSFAIRARTRGVATWRAGTSNVRSLSVR